MSSKEKKPDNHSYCPFELVVESKHSVPRRKSPSSKRTEMFEASKSKSLCLFANAGKSQAGGGGFRDTILFTQLPSAILIKCVEGERKHFAKAQNRAQPLAMQEQLPGVQGQDVAEGKIQAYIWRGNVCSSPDIPCVLLPLLPDRGQQVQQGTSEGGSGLLSRKLTSSFSIFRVDKRDCSCWHLCTSSLWTGCWAQSWEACQKQVIPGQKDTTFGGSGVPSLLIKLHIFKL